MDPIELRLFAAMLALGFQAERIRIITEEPVVQPERRGDGLLNAITRLTYKVCIDNEQPTAS